MSFKTPISSFFGDDRIFQKRSLLMQTATLFVGAALLLRYGTLQIVRQGYYKKRADNNRIRVIPLIPERGAIIDRRGNVLAGVQQNFRLDFLVAETKGVIDHQQALENIRKQVKLSNSEWDDITSRIDLDKEYFPVTIKENITWDEMVQYRQASPFYPGLLVSDNFQRIYPYKEDFTHIVGSVGNPTQQEAEQNRQLRVEGLKTGKSGIEKWRDNTLRGSIGTLSAEVDAYGKQIRDLGSTSSTAGRSVITTLDSHIQTSMMAAMKQHLSGAGVLLDIENGNVLAMGSLPSFDPNVFVGNKVLPAEWQNISKNELSPLPNRTVQGAYAPASTLKPLVALAGLKNGIDPKATVTCQGYMNYGDRRYHCWRQGGHGIMNMSDAIKHSCDVYFYTIALNIGIEKIFRVFGDFGLGHTTGFIDRNERSGFLPSEGWKMQATGEAWYGGETMIHAIGQGYLLITPLQLAVVMAAIANGGKLVTPGIFNEKRPIRQLTNYAPEHINFIQHSMWRVINEDNGTAIGSRLPFAEFEMAGKTGTAQVRKLQRYDDGRPIHATKWEEYDHGLFIAYAPYHQPKYATAVVIEHGQGGARAAAPVARAAMIAAYETENLRNNEQPTKSRAKGFTDNTTEGD